MSFDVSILDKEDVQKTVFDHLQKKGFVVKPKADYEKDFSEHLKGLSHEDERVNHLVAPVVRKEREAVEKLANELFPGAQKLSVDGKTESHLDFLKRTLTSKMSELEEKAKKGVTNDDFVKQFDEYKIKASEREKALQKKIEEMNATQLQKERSFEVERVITKLSSAFTKDERVAPLINTVLDAARNSALKESIEIRNIGGKDQYVVIESSGSVKFKEGNPYTLEMFMKDQLSGIMDTGRQGQGSGGKENPPGNAGSLNIDSTKVKTRIQLDEYIKNELKMSLSDPEVLKMRNEYAKQHNLPLQ